MKKKIIWVFALAIFLISGSKAFAFDTTDLSPSGYGSTNSFTNPTNAYSTDGSYATYSYGGSGSPYLLVNGFGFTIPTNATINSITFSVRGHVVTHSGSLFQLLVLPSYEGNLSLFGSITAGACTTAATITPAGSDSTITSTINASCFASHTIVPADLNSNNFSLRAFISSNGSVDYSIDSVTWRVNYSMSTPGLSFTTTTASASGQFVTLNLQGRTATNSATYQCTIGLFERCSGSGYAAFTSTTPVAHVLLDGSYTGTTTKDNGSGYYTAHGWGASSEWSAENVTVPYNPNMSCDYPITYYCQDLNRNIIIQSDYSQDTSLIATPSAGLTSTLFTAPEPSNPLSWIVWKLQQVFWQIFGIQPGFDQQMYNNMHDNFTSRAPFAYANAVLSLDFSGSLESSAAPTISIALAHREGILPAAMVWTPPQVFYDFMAIFKTAISVILWLLFVLYLFFVPRRLFK